MAGNYIQPGNVLDYQNPADAAPILSGDVVALPTRIGVALVTIAAGGTGSVQMTGVFAIPKKAGESLPQGAIAHWDTGATATTGDVVAGMVWETALAADPLVLVKIG
jgi:predicted RecA/RadA family phage recombinase